MSTHPALGAAPRLLTGVPRGDCVSSGASKLGWPSLPAPTAQDTQGSIAPESARCGRTSPASPGRTGRTTSWSWLLAPQHTGTQTTRYTSSHVPLASRYRKTGIPSNFMPPWSTLPDEQGDRVTREDLSAGRSVNGEHRLWSDRPQRGCTGSPGKVPGGRDPPWATLPGGTARPLWGPHLREHSHTRVSRNHSKTRSQGTGLVALARSWPNQAASVLRLPAPPQPPRGGPGRRRGPGCRHPGHLGPPSLCPRAQGLQCGRWVLLGNWPPVLSQISGAPFSHV